MAYIHTATVLLFSLVCVFGANEPDLKKGLECEQVGDDEKNVICSQPSTPTSPNGGAPSIVAAAIAVPPSKYSEDLAKIPKPLNERAVAQSWRPCIYTRTIPYTPSCYLGTVKISPYLLYNSAGEPRYVYQSYDFTQTVSYVRCKRSVCYPRFYAGHSSDFRVDDTLDDDQIYPYPYPSGRCYAEPRSVSLLVWNPYLYNGLSWETFNFPSCCKCRLNRQWPGLPVIMN